MGGASFSADGKDGKHRRVNISSAHFEFPSSTQTSRTHNKNFPQKSIQKQTQEVKFVKVNPGSESSLPHSPTTEHWERGRMYYLHNGSTCNFEWKHYMLCKRSKSKEVMGDSFTDLSKVNWHSRQITCGKKNSKYLRKKLFIVYNRV